MSKRESSIKDLKKRASQIARGLKKKYSGATTALSFSSPHELLVATVLAAQCTDKKVNEVTAKLFKKYRTPADFAKADQKTLEKLIKPTGFFRNKARNIISLSKQIVDRFNGKVPDNLEDLTSLSGVGRKTANVVLAAAFGKPGIVVDTHMIRVANRLGLTTNRDPVKIEFDLMEILPKRLWGDFSFMITLHGRETCKARKPLCQICVIEKHCPSSLAR
ncbi:MAG: endonuclease III [bacterium]